MAGGTKSSKAGTALQPVIEVGNLGWVSTRIGPGSVCITTSIDTTHPYPVLLERHARLSRPAFVRNGVVMRVEQNHDHQTYEDLYGNRGRFAHNPRMCLKGFTFHWRVRTLSLEGR